MLYTFFFCRSYLTGLGRDDELLPPGAGEETKVITHITHNLLGWNRTYDLTIKADLLNPYTSETEGCTYFCCLICEATYGKRVNF